MIYTVTFNPALDYVMNVTDLQIGATNRTGGEHIMAGGKGINVSVVLQNLDVPSTMLGFIAGFTGQEINRQLTKTGCICEFISLSHGMSRINVKLKGETETELNARGPEIDAAALDALFRQLNQLREGDILVLAGSIPASVPGTIYEDMMQAMQDRNVQIIVDAERDLLRNTLPLRPFLIKPNHIELGQLFQTEITTKQEAAVYAKRLQEEGARNVLVSMSGKGAVLCTEDGQVLEQEAASGTVINSVGAGDSMVAGFLAGWVQRHDYRHALRMGAAAGAASAFSPRLAVKEDVLRLYDTLLRLE